MIIDVYLLSLKYAAQRRKKTPDETPQRIRLAAPGSKTLQIKRTKAARSGFLRKNSIQLALHEGDSFRFCVLFTSLLRRKKGPTLTSL